MDDTLSRDGFFVANNILPPAKVEILYEALERYFYKSSTKLMPPQDFFGIPELSTVPFLPATVAGLRLHLGDDYVTIPEHVVQADQFGGWHTDCGNQGHTSYCYQSDWVQIQCAVYLQGNDEVYGGGLDVKKRGTVST